ncbi:xanthine dehydrogenase family protein subunit M [Actinosynnema sp. NPDC020468]|uniref:FAD binding domain-containing protein n=1 Tax=Actinosynnema sp. NPDC020468 TaxID=3154488 RepID=UPI0033DD0B1F
MKNFDYAVAATPADAVRLVAERPGAAFVSGGTDLLNLMRDCAQTHDRLVDLNGLDLGGVALRGDVLRIGGLARMSDVARHPVVRTRFPVVSEALLASASPQIRNMAALGGNLLQRTRCGYFRDPGSACNKKVPGSGCPAITGENRGHAILGGTDQCIAVHPSDLGVSLRAVDAVIRTRGPRGERAIPFGEFQVPPGSTPERETVLEHGELITSIDLPFSALAGKSSYLKLRDRSSFEFAVVSVAAALELRGRTVKDVRLAFGGVATTSWRSTDAEAALRGKVLDAASIGGAADAAVRGAVPREHNGFKVELLRRAVTRALTDLGGVR